MGQQTFGEHNSQDVLDNALGAMAAYGEAAQGILRHRHHLAIARGEGIVAAGPGESPEQLAQRVQQIQQRALSEVRLSLRQIQLGIQSACASHAAVLAALERLGPEASDKPTAPTKLADAAGTPQPGPKLALA